MSASDIISEGQFGYHASHRGNRESILREGIKTSTPGAEFLEDGEEDLEHPKGVYYTEPGHELWRTDGDVWKVDLGGLRGPVSNFAHDSHVTEDVPPNRLTLSHAAEDGETVHEGAFEDCKACGGH